MGLRWHGILVIMDMLKTCMSWSRVQRVYGSLVYSQTDCHSDRVLCQSLSQQPTSNWLIRWGWVWEMNNAEGTGWTGLKWRGSWRWRRDAERIWYIIKTRELCHKLPAIRYLSSALDMMMVISLADCAPLTCCDVDDVWSCPARASHRGVMMKWNWNVGIHEYLRYDDLRMWAIKYYT